VTGFHCKRAMRLLRVGQVTGGGGPRPGRRVYDDAVRQALIVVREASDRICSKRLRPLLPILVEAMAIPADPGGPPGNGEGSICRSQPPTSVRLGILPANRSRFKTLDSLLSFGHAKATCAPIPC
jgi:hypothetical protein